MEGDTGRNVSNKNTGTLVCTKSPTLSRTGDDDVAHSVYDLRTNIEMIRYIHATVGFLVKDKWL